MRWKPFHILQYPLPASTAGTRDVTAVPLFGNAHCLLQHPGGFKQHTHTHAEACNYVDTMQLFPKLKSLQPSCLWTFSELWRESINTLLCSSTSPPIHTFEWGASWWIISPAWGWLVYSYCIYDEKYNECLPCGLCEVHIPNVFPSTCWERSSGHILAACWTVLCLLHLLLRCLLLLSWISWRRVGNCIWKSVNTTSVEFP